MSASVLLKRRKESGVALLAFTVALAIVAFSIIMAFSVSTSKTQMSELTANQEHYLIDVRAKLVTAYAANALTLDADSTWSSVTTGDQVLSLAGIVPRWGLRAAISAPVAKDGIKYRVIAAWLPVDGDESGEPEPTFTTDGTFVRCPANTAACTSSKLYIVVSDGYAIQRGNAKKSLAQLEQLALNAQSFIKSKTLLDPERNVSVNYFRPPYGGCSPAVEQMPCVDSPQPIFGVSPPIRQGNPVQSMAELLGMPNAPLLNAWGLPVEVCNGNSCADGTPSQVRWDPLSQGPPYSMLLQSRNPWGGLYRVYAVQQI